MSLQGKLLSLAVCLTLILPGAAQAQVGHLRPLEVIAEKEGNPPGPTQSRQAPPTAQQSTADYWNAEARAHAQPMESPALPPMPEAQAESVQGEPGSTLGQAPAAEALKNAPQQFPEEWAKLGELAALPDVPEGTPGVFTRYLVNYYPQMHLYFPYMTVGKLYLTTWNGAQVYCTAAVISPYNIIVTAAHCVYDTYYNRWQDNWFFVPAERAGAAPFGGFPWTNATVLNTWIDTGGVSFADQRYDVALIRLGNNSAGYPVTYYTGWLGRAWNFPATVQAHVLGYPSNLDAGPYTSACVGETFYADIDVLGVGCDLSYGINGAPWIKNFAPYTAGANNYVDSVVSGGLGDTDNTMYGPRFSSDNILLLCNDVGC